MICPALSNLKHHPELTLLFHLQQQPLQQSSEEECLPLTPRTGSSVLKKQPIVVLVDSFPLTLVHLPTGGSPRQLHFHHHAWLLMWYSSFHSSFHSELQFYSLLRGNLFIQQRRSDDFCSLSWPLTLLEAWVACTDRFSTFGWTDLPKCWVNLQTDGPRCFQDLLVYFSVWRSCQQPFIYVLCEWRLHINLMRLCRNIQMMTAFLNNVLYHEGCVIEGLTFGGSPILWKRCPTLGTFSRASLFPLDFTLSMAL